MPFRKFTLLCAVATLALGSQVQAQPEAEVRLTVDETTSPVLRGGPLLARVIERETDLVPGQIADGNMGDIVLQNDFVRAILTHPDRNSKLPGGSGALVDLVYRSFPVDGIDYIQTTADTQSSVGVVRYTGVSRLEVAGNTTATVTLVGTASTADGAPELKVSTTYELPKDDSHLVVTTTFTNSSTTESASILPGDVADWGLLTSFAEGHGAVQDLIIYPSRLIAGIGDEVSVAFIHPQGQPLQAIVAPRLAVVQHYGKAALPEGVISRLPADSAAALRGDAPTPAPPTEKIPLINGPASVRQLILPPGTETNYLLPSSETPYSIPTRETPYSLLPNVLESPDSQQSSNWTPWGLEAPGGGDEKAIQSTTPRLQLAPGESYTVVRYIAVSDRNIGRITSLATQLQAKNSGQTAGAIAGVILDSSTAKPLVGADIFVSGGSDFQGTGTPRPIARLTTRADGTFGVRLPLGNYLVQANLMGHQALSGPALAQLRTTSPLVTVPVGMSGLSQVNLQVNRDGSDEKLPAKVTLIPKPGSPSPWFGSTSNVTSGSRNVYYLPNGQGTFPVTPGRYEMTVSRGPEYDIVRGELTVVPGVTQSVSISLPHSLANQVKGMVSMDAGIMTNASPAGTLDAESRVIQAVCEGVSVLVTGDYGVATDLNPVIARLGLADRVKAFTGRRWLLSAQGMTMDLLAYPLDPKTDQAMAEIIEKERAQKTSPDVILSDLRRQFPNVILQIDRPYDPDKGYLQSFEFDELRQTYSSAQVPPPDFDALQIVDGKRLGVQEYTLPRYHDLAARRAAGGHGLLVAAAGSNSRVGAADEVGSMRTYLITQRDTLPRFDNDALTTAIRSGRYMITNGPLIDLLGLDPMTNSFSARVGDRMNCVTTQTAVMRPMVYAAPWVGVNTITLYMDGVIADRTEVMPVTRPLRYPVQANVDSANKVRYLDADTMITASTVAGRRPMTPVLSRLPDVLGGDVVPFCYTGPVYVDYDGNGKITPKVKPDQP